MTITTILITLAVVSLFVCTTVAAYAAGRVRGPAYDPLESALDEVHQTIDAMQIDGWYVRFDNGDECCSEDGVNWVTPDAPGVPYRLRLRLLTPNADASVTQQLHDRVKADAQRVGFTDKVEAAVHAFIARDEGPYADMAGKMTVGIDVQDPNDHVSEVHRWSAGASKKAFNKDVGRLIGKAIVSCQARADDRLEAVKVMLSGEVQAVHDHYGKSIEMAFEELKRLQGMVTDQIAMREFDGGRLPAVIDGGMMERIEHRHFGRDDHGNHAVVLRWGNGKSTAHTVAADDYTDSALDALFPIGLHYWAFLALGLGDAEQVEAQLAPKSRPVHPTSGVDLIRVVRFMQAGKHVVRYVFENGTVDHSIEQIAHTLRA